MAKKIKKKYQNGENKIKSDVGGSSIDIKEKISEAEEKRLVEKSKSLFNYAKEARRKYDWEWLVRNLYYRGYHFARYNRNTNSVSFGSTSGVRIPINLLWAHLRGVRNQVTSFKPKWEVMPNVTTESAFENARYSGKTLDYIYEKSHIKRAIKELMTHALLYSVGIWQTEVDKNGDIVIRTVDPYDFYVDPNINSADINDPDYGAEFVIKTVSNSLTAVKTNPNYTIHGSLGADNEIASAEYKRFLIQATRNTYQRQKEEAPTVIIKECWMRERQDNGTFKMRVVTYTDSLQRPLRNELVEDTEYPFEMYQGDVAPLEIYGESWAKHLIPLNRVIDLLEGHIFEYNHLFARGRFVIDKNSGVRLIVNQHGQIIEKNRGSVVTSLPIAPLPEAPFEQLRSMRGYYEDVSGVHDVSLGRIPSGVKSGVGIAELKQADATNQSDLVDNLEDFLGRVGRKALKLVAENWTTTKLINTTGLGGKPDYFMAIGERGRVDKKKQKEGYTFGEMKLPLAIIGAENEVRVRVGSWLAYTKQARQEQLKELYRLGAIDQKTLLESLEFGDIDGVLQRSRDERLLQERVSVPSASVVRTTGEQMTDEELALAENELMLEGSDQPVEPDDDHDVHLAIHREVVDDRKYGDIVKAHMNEHINLRRWQRTQPVAPEEGAEATAGTPAGAGGAVPTPNVAAMMGAGVPMGGGAPS